MIEKSWKEIKWQELTQIVKDILWFYDENPALSCSFVPRDCFSLRYWEYLPLELEKTSNHYDIEFIREGCLIIINGIVSEYIPIETGVQDLFLETSWKTIKEFVENFKPSNSNQDKLKEITLLGLKIAIETDLTKDINNHPDLVKYVELTRWIDNAFIHEYYCRKLMK